MTATFEAPAPVPTTAPPPPGNPIGIALGEWLRELIWTGAATTPRSLQATAGMSEVGDDCDRQLAYKILGTTPSNLQSDPMASLVGTGIHLVLAEMFHRLDAGTGRWLIEKPVSYRGIPGTADAYDRRRKLLIDWKSTSKAKLRKTRADGPPRRYLVQTQLYAAALRELGEDPQQAALVYVARDGGLDELFVWPVAIDSTIADEAIARYERIAGATKGSLAEIRAKPTPLCSWCDFYRPGSTDLTHGCPGGSK